MHFDTLAKHSPVNSKTQAAVGFKIAEKNHPSVARRLLFTAGENNGDYVEKECFVATNLLYHILLLCSLYLL